MLLQTSTKVIVPTMLVLLMLFSSFVFADVNLKIYIQRSQINNAKYQKEINRINASIKQIKAKYENTKAEICQTSEFKLAKELAIINSRELEVYNHIQHEKKIIMQQHEEVLKKYSDKIYPQEHVY